MNVGDNLAFAAEGWQKPAVKVIGAKTFHWALVGERVIDDEISIGDYSIADSISKGITRHLLSEYRHRNMRVYRPKLPPGHQDIFARNIVKLFDYYGDQCFDTKGVLMVAVWCLLRKLGLQVEWWEHNSRRFWCLEFVEIVWRDLGYPLVPVSEPPYPTNMENSPMLELIWGTF